MISIHAPRVGSDVVHDFILVYLKDFNPRSPCGERPLVKFNAFYSDNFNPRSPCGERRENHPNYGKCGRFQSTLPVWGATSAKERSSEPSRISIHAPRVGSDLEDLVS